MSDASTVNAEQIEYWNGEAGRKWTRLQDTLDIVFAPVAEVAVERAAPRPGEAVLDLGCGCGASLLALGQRVGPSGRVVGVDISAPMLARALERSHGLPQVSLIQGDAQHYRFAPATFDLAFSRFGLMFFRDPDAAFLNLRRALKDDGRIVFACWRRLEDSSFMHLPLDAVTPILSVGERPPADEPGPFALADPTRLQGIITRAGFAAPAIDAVTLPMRCGGIDHALMLATQIGPAARAMADASVAQRDQAIDAVRAALTRHMADGEVVLEAGIWLVSARTG